MYILGEFFLSAIDRVKEEEDHQLPNNKAIELENIVQVKEEEQKLLEQQEV